MKIKTISLLIVFAAFGFSGYAQKNKPQAISRVLTANKEYNFIVVGKASDKPFQKGDEIVVIREEKIIAEGKVTSTNTDGSMVELEPKTVKTEFPIPGDHVLRK